MSNNIQVNLFYYIDINKQLLGIQFFITNVSCFEYTIGSKIDAHYQGKWYECDVLKIDAKKGLFIHWVACFLSYATCRFFVEVGFPKSQNQYRTVLFPNNALDYPFLGLTLLKKSTVTT